MRTSYPGSDDASTAHQTLRLVGEDEILAPTDDAAPHVPSVDIPDEIIRRVELMSRRIHDLARELNCLGYFDDDDDDRPRAA